MVRKAPFSEQVGWDAGVGNGPHYSQGPAREQLLLIRESGEGVADPGREPRSDSRPLRLIAPVRAVGDYFNRLPTSLTISSSLGNEPVWSFE
jgi:hypothetical protein